MTRKHYSKEFKLQAVMLMLKQQHPVAIVAKKLDIYKTHCTVGFKNMNSMVNVHSQEKDIGILLHNLN